MTYTFLSAVYANAEKTAIVATTKECGAVALSAGDTPEAWEALAASKIPVAAYVEPELPAEPPPAEKLAAFLSANPDVLDMITAP